MLADTARSRHGSLTRHAIGSIDVPTKVGEREAFVHGDLHPANVLCAANGPVVVDWEGVGSADAATGRPQRPNRGRGFGGSPDRSTLRSVPTVPKR